MYVFLLCVFVESWWITHPSEWCTTGRASVFHSPQVNQWRFMQLYGMETFGQQEGGRLRLIGLKLHSYQVLEISMRMRALLDQGPHLAWVLMVEETKVLMLKSGSISKRSIQDGLFTIIAGISYVLLMVFHTIAARINKHLWLPIEGCLIIMFMGKPCMHDYNVQWRIFFIILEKHKCSIVLLIIWWI